MSSEIKKENGKGRLVYLHVKIQQECTREAEIIKVGIG